mmetsp:Transcript_58923/g.149530  ORF Transcript_58923/g.149530 Transcript_58923/m.149530 type:complete len:223 (-) Transcript_58923:537-1205(-)
MPQDHCPFFVVLGHLRHVELAASAVEEDQLHAQFRGHLALPDVGLVEAFDAIGGGLLAEAGELHTWPALRVDLAEERPLHEDLVPLVEELGGQQALAHTPGAFRILDRVECELLCKDTSNHRHRPVGVHIPGQANDIHAREGHPHAQVVIGCRRAEPHARKSEEPIEPSRRSSVERNVPRLAIFQGHVVRELAPVEPLEDQVAQDHHRAHQQQSHEVLEFVW